MPLSSRAAAARARIAAKRRYHGPDADVADDIRELRSTVLCDRVRRIIEDASPLTADEAERLRALLTPEGAKVAGHVA